MENQSKHVVFTNETKQNRRTSKIKFKDIHYIKAQQ